MPTALITGIRGFTGRYLADALADEGYRVEGISPHESETAANIHLCDATDREALRATVASIKPDIVAHLAGIAFVAHGNVEEIYRTNIFGSRNLLEALDALARPPTAVLMVSSANVYGNTPADPIDEAVPVDPQNDYAISKLAMEQMTKLWVPRLPVTIVRPFNYTGVGQSERFLIPKLVGSHQRRDPEINLGNLDIARDFSDVRTVVDAYVRLLQRPVPGEIINVCSGVTVSLASMLAQLSEISGHHPRVITDPALVRENEVASLRGSNDKLISLIGKLEAHPLQETLHWMYEATS